MKQITIQMKDFSWNIQRDVPAPEDEFVIAMSPSGAVQIHYGRSLLPWAKWLTLKQFNDFVASQL